MHWIALETLKGTRSEFSVSNHIARLLKTRISVAPLEGQGDNVEGAEGDQGEEGEEQEE